MKRYVTIDLPGAQDNIAKGWLIDGVGRLLRLEAEGAVGVGFTRGVEPVASIKLHTRRIGAYSHRAA